jgi:hypothetical protein
MGVVSSSEVGWGFFAAEGECLEFGNDCWGVRGGVEGR